MVTARINLKNTSEDELLFTALLEAADSYGIIINGITKQIIIDKAKKNTKTTFIIGEDMASKGNIVDVNIAPLVPYRSAQNMRINIIKENSNTFGIVIATVDNPYIVTTNEMKRYKIQHSNEPVDPKPFEEPAVVVSKFK